jgi:hypothetical protein
MKPQQVLPSTDKIWQGHPLFDIQIRFQISMFNMNQKLGNNQYHRFIRCNSLDDLLYSLSNHNQGDQMIQKKLPNFSISSQNINIKTFESFKDLTTNHVLKLLTQVKM